MSDDAQMSAPPQTPKPIRFRLRAVLIAFAVLAPILWLCATAHDHRVKYDAEVAQRTKTIWTTLDATVDEVESVRAKLGRSPTNAQEIESTTGHPMIVRINDKLNLPVYYEPASSTSYRLVFSIERLEGLSGDFLMYDSTKPKAGWVVYYD